MLLFEVFADRGDLGEKVAAVEFERRHLAMRIALQMPGLAIFALAQIDGLLRHLDALFRHEHADHTRVRPDRVVQLHGVFSPWFLVEAWLLGAVEQATAGFVKWADHIFALPNVIQESH